MAGWSTEWRWVADVGGIGSIAGVTGRFVPHPPFEGGCSVKIRGRNKADLMAVGIRVANASIE